MSNQGTYPPPTEEQLVPPSAPKKRKWGLILTIVLIVVVVGLGVLRYFGPTMVTKGFMDAGFSNNSSSAVGYLCPAAQHATSLNSLAPTQVNFTIDTSGLAYDIQSESLSNATVHVHGSISAEQSSVNFDYTVSLQANSLWWCISQVTINSTS